MPRASEQLSQFGELVERLRQRMPADRRPGVTRLGELAGLSRARWHRVRTGGSDLTRPELQRLAEALGVDTQVLVADHIRPIGDREALPENLAVLSREEHDALDMPQQLRVRAKEFELEAAKAGADERALGFIHRTLFAPEAYGLRAGGYREQSPEKMLRHMEGLIIGLRAWLEEYTSRQAESARRG